MREPLTDALIDAGAVVDEAAQVAPRLAARRDDHVVAYDNRVRQIAQRPVGRCLAQYRVQ